MTLNCRPYHSFQDFVVMTSILAVGRKTSKCPYYVHTGDLSWWMFYGNYDDSHWQDYIQIWEKDGHLCGWSMIDPDWNSFDVVLLPEMQGSKENEYILDKTIHNLTKAVSKKSDGYIRTVWVSEHDQELIQQLEKRGFYQDEDYMWYLERPLNARIPDQVLPQDFVIRPIRGEVEMQQREGTAYIAYGSTQRLGEGWSRYQNFVESPVYNPNYDLVTETPNGQIASFCIIWPDPVNHIGLVEPVGISSAFQNQGLGRAVVAEGLQQLKARGMNQAMICIEDRNTAALNLYQAVGFRIQHKLHTFIKRI